MLKKIRKATNLPIVAIGGISEQNAGMVWEAGANSVAMIGDLSRTENIAEKVRRILALRQAPFASSS